MSESKILFLDDMGWRHSSFTRLSDRMEHVRVWQAHSAKGAIALLDSVEFDQAFLDHDLSEDDVLMLPGGPSKVPTGMTVVEHIMTMAKPPQEIVVHSCNGPAAEEMTRRLESHPAKIVVRRVPFPHLIQLIEQSMKVGGVYP